MDLMLYFSFYSIWFLAATYVHADGGTVTINSAPAFTSLRGCMQSCLFWGCNAEYVDIGCLLGCGQALGPLYLDSCYCRSDLAPSASSLISSCATHYCAPNPGPDASSGVSLYADYCHVVFPTTTTNASTITLGQSSPTPAQTATGNSAATMASAPTKSTSIGRTTADAGTATTADAGTNGGLGSSSSNSGKLDRSDTIAVVMGILAILATCLAAYFARGAVVKIVRDRTSIFS